MVAVTRTRIPNHQDAETSVEEQEWLDQHTPSSKRDHVNVGNVVNELLGPENFDNPTQKKPNRYSTDYGLNIG